MSTVKCWILQLTAGFYSTGKDGPSTTASAPNETDQACWVCIMSTFWLHVDAPIQLVQAFFNIGSTLNAQQVLARNVFKTRLALPLRHSSF